MRAATVARTTGGALRGNPDVVITGAEVDSRLVGAGDLFVALPGSRVDGHRFVPAALETAAAALVRTGVELAEPAADRALISVPDPLRAYQQLAAEERRSRGWRVVAVTGSIGKTTTKDFLAELLGPHVPTGKTSGNRNSTLGLPAQILSQDDAVEVFVAEAGMSRRGELDLLGDILRPDVLVYTRIAPAHTEFFRDLDEIVEAKAELIPHLAADGTLVVNADDPRQAGFPGRTAAAVLAYGDGGAARLEDLEDLGFEGTRGALVLPSGRAPFHLPLAGRHQAENFLAAAAAAHAVGLGVADIAAGAARLVAADHRGRLLRLPRRITVIDDSYNASPSAMAMALELLAQCPGRRVAVLGEMYELGSAAAAAHRDLGLLAAHRCDLLLTVGLDLGDEVSGGAVAAGLSPRRILRAADAESAAEVLLGVLEPGDTVLVKGSRGVGLDRTVAALVEGVR